MDMNLETQINFVGCIALFQRRRDTAVGLVHFTRAQKDLIYYRNVLAQRAFLATLYSPVIKAIAARSETAPPEEQPGLLQLAQQIHAKVKRGF